MTLLDLGYEPHEFRSLKPGYRGTSLQSLFEKFPTEDACFNHIWQVKYSGNPECPRCGQNGRWRKHEKQKHFFHPCGGIVSPMARTLLDRTRISIQLWFYSMLFVANSAEGIGSTHLAREIGVSEPSTHRMLRRIRLHLAALDAPNKLGLKGEPVLCRIVTTRRVVNSQKNTPNKARILVMSNGKAVRSCVIYRPSRSDLIRLISLNVGAASALSTDCYWTHRTLSTYGARTPLAAYKKSFMDLHKWNDDPIHGFISYFRQSFFDQFRGTSLEHFWLYLKEYEFRYNRRRSSHLTFWDMVSRFPDLTENGIVLLNSVSSRINLRPAST